MAAISPRVAVDLANAAYAVQTLQLELKNVTDSTSKCH